MFNDKFLSKYKLKVDEIHKDMSLSTVDKLDKFNLLDKELFDTVNFNAIIDKPFDKSKHKYDGLSWQEAIDKCRDIENDNSLSIKEKIDEFDLIGFSRQNEFMGLSYELVPTGSFICEYRSFKVGYKTEIKNTLLYEPTNELLPKIYVVSSRQVYGF
jgi:hypothetical protein